MILFSPSQTIIRYLVLSNFWQNIGRGITASFAFSTANYVADSASSVKRKTRRSLAAGPAGTEFQVNTYVMGDQFFSSVAGLVNGGFAVTWNSFGNDENGIYAQLYTYNGLKNKQPFVIVNRSTDSMAQCYISGLNDGGFIAAWTPNGDGGGSSSTTGIYAQRYTSTGAKTGATKFLVSSYNAWAQYHPAIAPLLDGGFVITWTSGGVDGSENGVSAQRYTDSGLKSRAEFVANTNTAKNQLDSAIASLQNGGFVITWVSYHGSTPDIYGQRYGVDGLKMGSEFLINTNTANNQRECAVSGLKNGGFIVTWTSDDPQDVSTTGIYGQRYKNDGTKSGSEFQINTYTAGSQFDSAVTTLTNGNFVVVWTSDGQDGSGYGVYGQQFAEDGTLVGTEFLVNTYFLGDQSSASIAALTDGGFVVTWTSVVSWNSEWQDGSGNGVYGQRFDASGKKVALFFSAAPTSLPTVMPTFLPSQFPSYLPSALPTTLPSANPSDSPSFMPTSWPTFLPTWLPTNIPTFAPTENPTNLEYKLGGRNSHNNILRLSPLVYIGMILAACFVLFCSAVALLYYRRQKATKKNFSDYHRVSRSGNGFAATAAYSLQHPNLELPNRIEHLGCDEQAKVPIIPSSELSIDTTKKLGTGAFGVVYKASYRDSFVAVKQLQETNLTHKVVKKFYEEAQNCWLLQYPEPHPNIICLVGICTEEGNYSIVMELMVSSLRFFLQGDALDIPWLTRIAIARDIASGLAYLHSKRIIHRDLKSDNVLLRQDNQAVISDFGLSMTRKTLCSRSSQLPMNNPVGTPSFMAPEILNNGASSSYSYSSDVYSLGIVLWEISSREDPFQEYENIQYISRLTDLVVKRGVRPTISGETPAPFAALIKKCWARRSKDRPSCDDVLMSLEALSVNDHQHSLSAVPSALFPSTSSQLNINRVPPLMTLEEANSSNACCM